MPIPTSCFLSCISLTSLSQERRHPYTEAHLLLGHSPACAWLIHPNPNSPSYTHRSGDTRDCIGLGRSSPGSSNPLFVGKEILFPISAGHVVWQQSHTAIVCPWVGWSSRSDLSTVKICPNSVANHLAKNQKRRAFVEDKKLVLLIAFTLVTSVRWSLQGRICSILESKTALLNFSDHSDRIPINV